ncbi:MAG: hypothetical protein HWE34_07980 [Methylocystaceae bacterium]|nr:hypothetical protein [Methylocystaceae bacterium]
MSVTLGSNIFSNPDMRPHLKKYYESKYAPVHDRIAEMKESGVQKTVALPDGTYAKGLLADQYEAAIPSFDKWLELQEKIPSHSDQVFAGNAGNKTLRKHIELAKEHLQGAIANTPDQPSNVRAVFSRGDEILGFIGAEGNINLHSGALMLTNLHDKANKLGLQGEERIAYMLEQGEETLSRFYDDVTIETYSKSTMPTAREFNDKWYPQYDIDKAYQQNIENQKKNIAELEEQFNSLGEELNNQTRNISDLNTFLLKSLQEADLTEVNVSTEAQGEAETA